MRLFVLSIFRYPFQVEVEVDASTTFDVETVGKTVLPRATQSVPSIMCPNVFPKLGRFVVAPKLELRNVGKEDMAPLMSCKSSDQASVRKYGIDENSMGTHLDSHALCS